MAAVPAMPGVGTVHAQVSLNKPIRIITSEVGGGNDLRARMVAPPLAQNLGQPVVIDNRGGNPIIPTDMVIKASPDGHTLGIFGGSAWLLPFMQKVSYDPQKDLTPITILTSSPAVLVVHPSLPVKSVKELLALARAKPAELNYASGIAGSLTHLPAELFKSMAKVDIVRVPFKGAAPALQSILAAQTQVMFANPTTVEPQIKAGKLRALGVTSPKPMALYPELPTVASEGVPGYEATSTVGVFGPAKMPAAVVKRLNAEFVKALTIPDVRDRFEKSGQDVVANSSAEFAAFIKADMARLGRLIKSLGITAD